MLNGSSLSNIRQTARSLRKVPLVFPQVQMLLIQQVATTHQPFYFSGWYNIERTVTLSVIGFIALIVMLRVSGKRTLSKLNAFDFVFVVACGSVFAASIIEKDVTLLEGVFSL